MTTYIKDTTQEGRILKLLRDRGNMGAKAYEFASPRPLGLGVMQYNARIYGLRHKGYQIINKEPGHFVLIETDKQTA
jgi:hypothetical protein